MLSEATEIVFKDLRDRLVLSPMTQKRDSIRRVAIKLWSGIRMSWLELRHGGSREPWGALCRFRGCNLQFRWRVLGDSGEVLLKHARVQFHGSCLAFSS